MESIILDLLKRQGEKLTNIETLLTISKTVLNLDEACTLTGLSKSHIYKLTCWGKIPYYKQAKHLYFDRLELENWLKTNRFKPSEELEKEASTYVALNRKGGLK
ncbi:MAG TPA: helix-turn-helix domain-containing protein [Bacteroidales bacterium]|jgi:excisionase family DNA binding protein|nr:helix-turn-helix domain-containing protein [Bacteroidales bacterium]HPM87425.1 helix-turn-helix domain-containing protein [Bacteroidales bacterium]